MIGNICVRGMIIGFAMKWIWLKIYGFGKMKMRTDTRS